MCDCTTCYKCVNRARMRAIRAEKAKPKLDALDRKAIAVWAGHRDIGERRDPLASTWRAIDAML